MKNLRKIGIRRSFFALLLCFAITSGCATVQNVSQKVSSASKEAFTPKNGRMDASLGGGITVYYDAKKYLSDIIVNISANQTLQDKPTALFMPLGLTQDHPDHRAISQGVSRILWQEFLGEETFSVLEFASINPPYLTELGLNMARAKGAQFLVGGYIPYYLNGATVGDSKVAIHLEIYDVSNGALLWSIHQSGVLPYKADNDNVLYTSHNRMPMDPMSALISAIGEDMGRFLLRWTDEQAWNNKNRESSSSSSGPSAFGKY